jgi:hypothetical protein
VTGFRGGLAGRQRFNALRTRCEAKLRKIDLPSPFDLRVFCERVEAQRQRQLILHPVLTTVGPCGLWVSTPLADHIFYEQATTPFHQLGIILHEISHLLCEHHPNPASVQDLPALLFPDLQPDLLHRVLQRTRYSSEEEQEAELLASLILEKVLGTSTRTGKPASTPIGRLVGDLERYLAGRTAESS